MFRKYLAQVWTQAKADFLVFFDLHKASGWVKAFGPLILGFIVAYAATGQDALISTGVSVLAGLAYALVVGGYNLLVAPAKLDAARGAKLQELERERNTLLDARKPRFEILYSVGSPYQQSLSYTVRLVDMLARGPAGTQSLHRVGVHNLSQYEAIEDLTLELEKIEPNIMQSLPMPLHPMHGPNQLDLTADETKFFEVLSWFHFEVDPAPFFNSNQFLIHHTVNGIPNLIPVSLYTVTLVARAKKTTAVRRQFTFGVGRDYAYFFAPVE